MSNKQTPSHSDRTKAGIQRGQQIVSAQAERRTLERNEAGRFMAKVSHEDWLWVIDQVRAGEPDAAIIRKLSAELEVTLSVGIIALKRRQDEAFAAAYWEALEDAMLAVAQDVRAVTRGLEGYSSGDVQRDRLIVETDLKLAGKLTKKLADKPLIDARSVQIVVRGQSDADDLS